MEEKFINFLKKTEIYNENLLDYLKNRTTVENINELPKDFHVSLPRVNKNLNEVLNIRDYANALLFIGTYPQVDENNILKSVNICVPKMTNDITVGMNIHEYVKALMLYRNLGKEYQEDKYEELMPTLYELVYLKENDQEDYLNLYLEAIKEEDNYLTMLLNIFDKDNVNVKK